MPPKNDDLPDQKTTSESPLSVLDVLAEVRKELAAVKADNAAMRQELADAKEKMGVGLDHGHVNFFADKWFHHDRPQPDQPEPKKPMFDPYTGDRLSVQ